MDARGAVDLSKYQWTKEDVRSIHKLDDVDTSPQAHHHTLGLRGNQAMRGNILADITLNGTLAGVEAALRQMGAS